MANKRPPTYFPLLLLFATTCLGITLGAAPDFTEPTEGLVAGDVAWMIAATAMVLFMTPGLSFFYGGMVGRRSVISTMLQSFICMGAVSIIWLAFGFSLAFGESIGGIIGNPFTFAFFKDVGLNPNDNFSSTIPFALFALFQLKFAIICPALVTGSFAERVRFTSYVLFACLFSIVIYSPLAHMTWHPDGLLRNLGVLDFAGGTVVHMSAGVAALIGALYLGKRNYNTDQLPSNIPFVLLGTGMLWFGWFGFNAGSALEAGGLAVHAFLTTNMASAMAMITWLAFELASGRKASAVGAGIGAVVGLVAITPAAGFVTVSASLAIGFISSGVCFYAVKLLSKTGVDDTLDVFPCHGVGGILGMVLTGVFAVEGGLITGETSLFWLHIVSCIAVIAFVAVASWVLFYVTDKLAPLRVAEHEEEIGLDISQHGETISNELEASFKKAS